MLLCEPEDTMETDEDKGKENKVREQSMRNVSFAHFQ